MTTNRETYKQALSIRQPWAWLIAHGYKDIENRCWQTRFKGEFFIHAAKGMTRIEDKECREFVANIDPAIIIPEKKDLCFGGIVGVATITDCVAESDSPWFTGEYGFVIQNPRVLSFMQCVGSLKFFYPSY